MHRAQNSQTLINSKTPVYVARTDETIESDWEVTAYDGQLYLNKKGTTIRKEKVSVSQFNRWQVENAQTVEDLNNIIGGVVSAISGKFYSTSEIQASIQKGNLQELPRRIKGEGDKIVEFRQKVIQLLAEEVPVVEVPEILPTREMVETSNKKLEESFKTGNLETVKQRIQDDEYLMTVIDYTYREKGTIPQLALEGIINDLMQNNPTSVYIGNIDLTTANSLDKTDALGDDLKAFTLEYFTNELRKRGYTADYTATLIQTRLVIRGVPQDVIQEISEIGRASCRERV